MADWSKKFKVEYDYMRAFLNNELAFAEEWRPLIRELRKLMNIQGFDTGSAAALTQLRKKVVQGEKSLLWHKTVSEDQGILSAVGGWTDDGSGVVDDNRKMCAAALKMLRHVYLLNRWGSRKVWLFSLPEEFLDWPSDDMSARATTQMDVRRLLRSSNEIFNSDQKKYLASAAQYAMAWCQKADIILANANQAINGKTKDVGGLDIVKRWFADPATTTADMATYIGTLTRGVKAIIAMLGRGQFVLTDWVPLRAATEINDIDMLNSEAFTFRSRHEGMDVVYIERSFFGDFAGSVLRGQNNWTRILVHELSHLVCGTTDIAVNAAEKRYAHYGIGLHAGFNGSEAIRNADSWAFFCADCARVLSESERKHALRIR